MTVVDTWDLESIFAGGSASAEFRDFVAELERDVAGAGERVRALDDATPDAEVRAVLLDAQAAEERLDQAFSFAECLRAQDTADAEAVQWVGRVDALGASLKALGAALSAFTARLADERWRTLTEERRAPSGGVPAEPGTRPGAAQAGRPDRRAGGGVGGRRLPRLGPPVHDAGRFAAGRG